MYIYKHEGKKSDSWILRSLVAFCRNVAGLNCKKELIPECRVVWIQTGSLAFALLQREK